MVKRSADRTGRNTISWGISLLLLRWRSWDTASHWHSRCAANADTITCKCGGRCRSYEWEESTKTLLPQPIVPDTRYCSGNRRPRGFRRDLRHVIFRRHLRSFEDFHLQLSWEQMPSLYFFSRENFVFLFLYCIIQNLFLMVVLKTGCTVQQRW